MSLPRRPKPYTSCSCVIAGETFVAIGEPTAASFLQGLVNISVSEIE